MKIITAESKFLRPCFGVERAFEKCLEMADREDCIIYGELVHNRQTVDLLEQKGLFCIDSLEAAGNRKVIIRAHGIDRGDLERLEAMNSDFVDLTCPFVKKFIEKTRQMENRGFQILIIGDVDHIEIKNVCSYLKNPIVVKEKGEIGKLPEFDRIAVFSQTTALEKDVDCILSAVREKYGRVRYVNTRCAATEERQKEAERLSRKADLVFVVGGKRSANARNLVAVCRRNCRAELAADCEDIDPEILEGVERAGVIAAASTPLFAVERVIKCLEKAK